jgi:hypothetical protein
MVIERFKEHRDLLTAVAYRVLGTLADAEDVVQEAWPTGDAVVAPGLLSEVSAYGALTAAKAVLKEIGPRVSA